MNVKEIVERLDEVDLIYGYEAVSKAQEMLRQQADRIAKLEKENKALHELVKQRIARNVELQNLLAPQTKPLSDDEIRELWFEPTLRYNPFAFAREIEKRILGK